MLHKTLSHSATLIMIIHNSENTIIVNLIKLVETKTKHIKTNMYTIKSYHYWFLCALIFELFWSFLFLFSLLQTPLIYNYLLSSFEELINVSFKSSTPPYRMKIYIVTPRNILQSEWIPIFYLNSFLYIFKC